MAMFESPLKSTYQLSEVVDSLLGIMSEYSRPSSLGVTQQEMINHFGGFIPSLQTRLIMFEKLKLVSLGLPICKTTLTRLIVGTPSLPSAARGDSSG